MNFITWIIKAIFSFSIKGMIKIEKKLIKVIDAIAKQLEKLKTDLLKAQEFEKKLNLAKDIVFPVIVPSVPIATTTAPIATQEVKTPEVL
jgi:hypothetical protein